MAKRLVDIDAAALDAAQAVLGTESIDDTVNLALRLATDASARDVDAATTRLASIDFASRDDAWR